MYINGSLRSTVELLGPSDYIGIDIQMGHGVDQICKADDCINKFGYNRFDVVICTEVLEHAKNWKKTIHNLKSILKPNGILIITTRSRGFPYHGYPFDFWRYEISDMESIFRDFEIKTLENDNSMPGVFLLAKKPENFIENKFCALKLYSMILEKKSSITAVNIYWIFLNIQLKILGLRSDGYCINRIKYYNRNPLAFFTWLAKKLKTYFK